MNERRSPGEGPNGQGQGQDDNLSRSDRTRMRNETLDAAYILSVIIFKQSEKPMGYIFGTAFIFSAINVPFPM